VFWPFPFSPHSHNFFLTLILQIKLINADALFEFVKISEIRV